MISKGKFRHLVNLYRPDGFYHDRGKLCYKDGKTLIIGLVPINAGGTEINFDVLEVDGSITPNGVVHLDMSNDFKIFAKGSLDRIKHND